MKTLTVSELARNLSAVLDRVEREQEKLVLVRSHRRIARLVPEPPAQNALEMFSDIYGTLDDSAASSLAEALRSARRGKRGTIGKLRDPWD